MQTASLTDLVSVADYLAAEEYVVVARAAREVTVFRRASGWGPRTVTGNEPMLMLESLAVSLPFGLIYEGV